uniref:Uncharacterized protein n=1 Tax=Salix viminalis TaxID=40686 RepID=A0A6N2LHE9_SALVM
MIMKKDTFFIFK